MWDAQRWGALGVLEVCVAPACMHNEVLILVSSQTYQPCTLHHSCERHSLPIRPDKALVQVLQAPDTLSNVKE